MLFFYLGPSREAVSTPVVFLIHLFLFLLLAGVSTAAPRTVWYNVLKIGKLLSDSPLILCTKFDISASDTLAPPMGQTQRCVYT